MNVEELRRKLLAAAKAHPADETVPYAFEKRIMHRINSVARVDVWAAWAPALWRAAGPCVALALLLAAWSMLSGPAPGANTPTDVSQDFENTVLAAATFDQPPADSPR